MRVGMMTTRGLAWLAMLAMPFAAAGLGRFAWHTWTHWPAVWSVDDALGLAAAAVGAAVAGYLTVTGALMALGAAVRGGTAIPRVVAALAPAGWQRVTSIALGIGLTSGLAGPALAAPDTIDGMPPSVGWADAPVAAAPSSPVEGVGTASEGSHVRLDLESVSIGWADTSPDPQVVTRVAKAPTVESQPAAPAVEAQPSASVSERPAQAYVVQPGDSLWRITAALLGDEASDAQIARAWPELYELNREAIGADPALIHAGLELSVPQELIR